MYGCSQHTVFSATGLSVPAWEPTTVVQHSSEGFLQDCVLSAHGGVTLADETLSAAHLTNATCRHVFSTSERLSHSAVGLGTLLLSTTRVAMLLVLLQDSSDMRVVSWLQNGVLSCVTVWRQNAMLTSSGGVSIPGTEPTWNASARDTMLADTFT